MKTNDLLGRVLNNTYRVESLLGSGGMGSVYRAGHLRLPRNFAVKVLHEKIEESHEAYVRFRREAEVSSSLIHEHIVQIIDFNFTEEGLPYIVMELLEGEDLASRLAREGQLSITTTVKILVQVCSALLATHAKGVVHRDIKPHNIFLCRRETGWKARLDPDDVFVKVLDFGISKIRKAQTAVTKTKAILGTPSYMAPEQAKGHNRQVDHRTDLYALGAVAYEMLSGHPPFEGPSPLSVLYKVTSEQARDLRELNPKVPPATAAVLHRALQKDKQDRYSSSREFGEALIKSLDAPAREETRDEVTALYAWASKEKPRLQERRTSTPEEKLTAEDEGSSEDYEQADDVEQADDLEQAEGSGPVGPGVGEPSPPVNSVTSPHNRSAISPWLRSLVLAGGGALLLGAAVFLFITSGWRTDAPPNPEPKGASRDLPLSGGGEGDAGRGTKEQKRRGFRVESLRPGAPSPRRDSWSEEKGASSAPGGSRASSLTPGVERGGPSEDDKTGDERSRHHEKGSIPRLRGKGGPRGGPRDGPRGGPRDGPRGGPRDGPRGGPRDGPRDGPRGEPGLRGRPPEPRRPRPPPRSNREPSTTRRGLDDSQLGWDE